ncbi:MAG: hypothetical protein WDZ39_00100 [Candidatus Spechtbacterales bacterium]
MTKNRRNKLMLRWSIFTFAAIAAFWTIWYFTAGSVPVVHEIQLTESTTLTLPFAVSRWFDVLLGPVYSVLLIQTFYAAKKEESVDGDLVAGLAVGLFAGLAFALASVLAGGLAFALAFGLVFGLAVGLVVALAFALAFGLVAGLAAGLVFGLVTGLAAGLAFALAVALAFGLAFGLVCVIRPIARWLQAKEV